jgi:hypothetical protein
MTFTDAQVQGLKDSIAKIGSGYISGQYVLDLLARLEAAEKFCDGFCSDSWCLDEDGKKDLKMWRKAAGK